MSVAEFLAPDEWFQPGAGPRYMQLRQRLHDGIAEGLLGTGQPAARRTGNRHNHGVFAGHGPQGVSDAGR